MRRLIRIFAIEVLALYFVTLIASGLHFDNYLEGVFITGIAMAIAAIFIKPIINFLLLPLTLATLGLFRFMAHVITLYVVDLALPQFSVSEFNFPGLTSTYLDLPPLHFSGIIMSYIAFSVLISILATFMHWIVK